MIIALVVFCIGGFLAQKAHKILLDDEPTDLVTDGIMGRVRHPMYLGIILIYLSFVLSTMSLLSLIPWFVVVVLHDKFASYEELKLEERFGEAYKEYKQKVPKWIPRL
jgi:protein-S-isoprenylcysteine O-methyltransferase Ste14